MRSTVALLLATTLLGTLACGDDGNAPPPPTGAITLALDPTTRTVVQGQNATITATITRTAPFAGPVALVFESAQAGLTGTFAPDSIRAGATTSTLTVAAAATVAPGDYPITVRARAAGLTEQTTTATITVAVPQSFTLTASPDAITIEQGSQSVSLARITRAGGFTGGVQLAVSGLPDSIRATVATPTLAGDTSSVQFVVGAAVTPGPYNAILTATATGFTPRVDTVAITVRRRPSYTLAVAPDSLSVVQGLTGASLVRLTRDSGFVATVTLTVDSLPPGITATVAPSAVAGDTARLTLAVAAGRTPGVYPVIVRGSTPNRPATADTLRLTVVAAPAAIRINAIPDTLVTTQGRDTTFRVLIARTNYADTVRLAITGAPSGVTASVTPTTGDTAMVMLDVADSTVVGTVTLTVTASGSGVTNATDTIVFTVNAMSSSRVTGEAGQRETASAFRASTRDLARVRPRGGERRAGG